MKIYEGDKNFMKIPKKKSPIKDLLKKGTVKGVKFIGKAAISPLSLAFGAGTAIAKASERKPFRFPTTRRFDKYGRQN